MVCVPCVLVPLLLFLWGIIKPMLNWFRRPVENSEDQNNADNDQVCSLLSSCPCINKNIKSPTDQADIKTSKNETLTEGSLETSDINKKDL